MRKKLKKGDLNAGLFQREGPRRGSRWNMEGPGQQPGGDHPPGLPQGAKLQPNEAGHLHCPR